MTDDAIQRMTREFASNPDSLVFLDLGEALRVRGERDAARRVTLAGIERYPELLDAYDLYARILVDFEMRAEARHAWNRVLEHDARHAGAHKGLGFLEYRDGDLDQALEHLERALASDPGDASVVQALRVVRATVDAVESQESESTVFQGLAGSNQGMLLVDLQGRLLGGGVSPGEPEATEAVAAHLAGVAREGARAARMLNLGKFEWLIAEGENGNLHVTQPTEETCLLLTRDRSVPAGRLAVLAAKSNEAARRWIAEQQL